MKGCKNQKGRVGANLRQGAVKIEYGKVHGAVLMQALRQKGDH
jgi:hypothetical protein